MKKWLVKMFVPSTEKIAEGIVDRLSEIVNESQQLKNLSKYCEVSEQIISITYQINKILSDGTVSDNEKEQIKTKLMPVIDHFLKML